MIDVYTDLLKHREHSGFSLTVFFLRVMGQISIARQSIMRVSGVLVKEKDGVECTMMMGRYMKENGFKIRGMGKAFSDYVSNQSKILLRYIYDYRSFFLQLMVIDMRVCGREG